MSGYSLGEFKVSIFAIRIFEPQRPPDSVFSPRFALAENSSFAAKGQERPITGGHAKPSYARKIKETTDGGRGRTRGQARPAIQIFPQGSFETDGGINERKTARRFRSHQAQEIADEKAQEKTLNADRLALGPLPSSRNF